MAVTVTSFFHPGSNTFSHIVVDMATSQAAIIDPVLDYTPETGLLDPAPAQPLIAHVRDAGLHVAWLLETHAHADHVSAGRWLQRDVWPDAQLAIGHGIAAVQDAFAPRYALDAARVRDDAAFDRLLHDGEQLPLGDSRIEIIAVPGHTSDSVAYLVDDALFPGDSLFMPDGGTARCDFPGGDARQLYRSIQRMLALPDTTRVFICHDYGPGGRPVACQTTISEQRAHNIHLRDGVSEDAFVQVRQARDATLSEPKLMLPSVRANITGGGLPE